MKKKTKKPAAKSKPVLRVKKEKIVTPKVELPQAPEIWTRFMDMHSGGRAKVKIDGEEIARIYIQLPQKEAEALFELRFLRNPNHVTCSCCGEDYSISEEKSLEQATAYDRGCEYDDKIKGYAERPCQKYRWQAYKPLQEFLKEPGMIFIFAKDITEKERTVVEYKAATINERYYDY